MDIADTMNVLEGVSALAVATGIVPAAVRYFQAKGVDITAVRNNSLVRAAGAAGVAALVRLAANGANLRDPAVFAAATQAAETSVAASHAGMISDLGATPADVARVAAEQTAAALAPHVIPAAVLALSAVVAAPPAAVASA